MVTHVGSCGSCVLASKWLQSCSVIRVALKMLQSNVNGVYILYIVCIDTEVLFEFKFGTHARPL